MNINVNIATLNGLFSRSKNTKLLVLIYTSNCAQTNYYQIGIAYLKPYDIV